MIQAIKCPKCRYEIPLTEALSSQLGEEIRKEYESEAQKRELELTKRREALEEREQELETSRQEIDETVSRKLAEERAKLEAEATRRASEQLGVEVTDLRNQVAEREKTLAQARKTELDTRKRQRELEDEKRNLELDVARRVDAERKEIRAQADLEAQNLREGIAKEREELEAREKMVSETKKGLEVIVSQRVSEERTKIEAQATRKATEATGLEVADLKGQVEEKARELAAAHKKELELRQQQRQLESEKENLELQVARRLDEERQKVREEAVKKAEEAHVLKDKEKDKIIADMKAQLAEVQRRADQGSQQAQGEVLELDLEELLKATFPQDITEPVPKGRKGADVIQRVHDGAGRPCGTIVWEAKHTKSWNATWVGKLKDDKREAKADLAVLLTTALPKEIETFGPHEGVWVTNRVCAMSLGCALRDSLIHITAVRTASMGKQSKMELLYDYLSGSEFRHRVEAIVEAFMALKSELDAERRTMEKVWAARAKQIDKVIANTAGMYGELQGISGAALPKIERLELKALPDSDAQQ